MVDTPLTLTIIVPVYNTERYLHRCIDSILNQSFVDYELLLINDGSTDKSSFICDEYAKKDDRIRVFHKENGGASSARNVGLDYAKGEWVTFIDSDDWVEDDYLVNPYESDVQLIVRNWRYANGEVNHYLAPQFVGKESFSFFLQSNIHLDAFRTACCSFFRRRILEDNHIRFMESIRLGEDTLFVMEYYKFCSSLQVFGDSFYVYNRQDNWGDKYHLSLAESLDFLNAFWIRYEGLQIESDHLKSFIFSFFGKMTFPKDKMTGIKWSLSDPVLKYKKSMIPQKGLIFRLNYYVKKLLSCFLSFFL